MTKLQAQQRFQFHLKSGRTFLKISHLPGGGDMVVVSFSGGVSLLMKKVHFEECKKKFLKEENNGIEENNDKSQSKKASVQGEKTKGKGKG